VAKACWRHVSALRGNGSARLKGAAMNETGWVETVARQRKKKALLIEPEKRRERKPNLASRVSFGWQGR